MSREPPAKHPVLTERQEQTVARIIERHVGWMINWSPSKEAEAEAFDNAAKAVARYIARIKP